MAGLFNTKLFKLMLMFIFLREIAADEALLDCNKLKSFGRVVNVLGAVNFIKGCLAQNVFYQISVHLRQ